jgi:hypothetical protein
VEKGTPLNTDRQTTEAELFAIAIATDAVPAAPAMPEYLDLHAQLVDLWQRTRAMQLDLWTLTDAADLELTGDLRATIGKAIAGMSRAIGATSDWTEYAARHLQIDDPHPDGPGPGSSRALRKSPN